MRFLSLKNIDQVFLHFAQVSDCVSKTNLKIRTFALTLKYSVSSFMFSVTAAEEVSQGPMPIFRIGYDWMTSANLVRQALFFKERFR